MDRVNENLKEIKVVNIRDLIDLEFHNNVPFHLGYFLYKNGMLQSPIYSGKDKRGGTRLFINIDNNKNTKPTYFIYYPRNVNGEGMNQDYLEMHTSEKSYGYNLHTEQVRSDLDIQEDIDKVPVKELKNMYSMFKLIKKQSKGVFDKEIRYELPSLEELDEIRMGAITHLELELFNRHGDKIRETKELVIPDFVESLAKQIYECFEGRSENIKLKDIYGDLVRFDKRGTIKFENSNKENTIMKKAIKNTSKSSLYCNGLIELYFLKDGDLRFHIETDVNGNKGVATFALDKLQKGKILKKDLNKDLNYDMNTEEYKMMISGLGKLINTEINVDNIVKRTIEDVRSNNKSMNLNYNLEL